MSRKGRLPKGAPRSAERQVFMFGRFAEPLPSDESDDSDFELCSDQETTRFVIATTVEEKQRSSQGKSRKTREKESNEIGNRMEQLTGSQNDLATMMTTGWSQLIPVELLIRIFQLVVDDTGSVPFLCRMSRVCKRWRDVACEPLLWRKVNLSPLALKCMRSATDATFERLAPARFTPVKVLNLDGWKKLTDKGLKAITTHCTQLQSIVLSQCDNLTSKGIASLADSCGQLIMVDVAMTKIDISCLSHLTKQLGNQLEEVSLRNCLRLRGEQILPYLQNCQNLTVLDLTGTNIRKLNVEKLQVGCPKLKELYLANLLLHSTPTSSDKHYSETRGFPQLETLCLACGSLGGLAMTDQFLYRILKGSTNLKLLDIRGLHKLTDKGLEKLPAISLQQLFLSDTQATFGIVAVLVNKWHFSLEVLDLSSNRYVSDEAMDLFRNFEMPRLHVLDLSSTNVTAEGVRKAVKGCPNLKDLNLTSCRGLPRGAKQRHDGARLNSLIRRLMDDSEQ